jgi:hypothetical protein
MTKHLCNDLHAELGVVFHCEADPHETGDHHAIGGKVTWPQHEASGARWVIRHPGAFLWHRIETRGRTACGVGITNLTLTTLRGRTLAQPPADGLVCAACLSVAPGPDETLPAVA